jgi:hypothetical protein
MAYVLASQPVVGRAVQGLLVTAVLHEEFRVGAMMLPNSRTRGATMSSVRASSCALTPDPTANPDTIVTWRSASPSGPCSCFGALLSWTQANVPSLCSQASPSSLFPSAAKWPCPPPASRSAESAAHAPPISASSPCKAQSATCPHTFKNMPAGCSNNEYVNCLKLNKMRTIVYFGSNA